MAFLGQEEQIRELQNRFQYLYTVLFLGLSLLVARLVYLQILKGDQMRQYSEENRTKRVKVAAPRGMIFDRNHKLLIDNRPDFDLEIIPQYLRESQQEHAVLEMLSNFLTMKKKDIEELFHKAKSQPSFMPVKIKTDLTRDEVALIEVHKIDMPGVEVRQEIRRTNIYQEVAAHLLGYIGEVNATELPLLNQGKWRYKLGDSIGKFGLEQRMEEQLRGIDGEEIKEVDALGRVKLDRKKSHMQTNTLKQTTPGKNLILSIDEELQRTAYEAFGEKIGAMVAVDPNNGEILAMLSRPSFDPTTFSRGIPAHLWNKLLKNENHPLRDKTIQDHYPPASTFKTITAIAGLEEGVIDENTKFHCPGVIKIGNRLYHCHKKTGHGEMNLVQAITRSCDVFFYRVALKLTSVDDIAKWANKFGLGKKTGVNLAGEVPGLIPTEAWKKKRFNQAWNAGETATVAIGQSFVLTTALQLANTYAAIGNGGTLYRPYIVKEIQSFDGKTIKQYAPELLGKVQLQSKTIQLVKQGLWGAINTSSGTAYSQRLPGMDFVGKTGTAQHYRIDPKKVYQKCELMKFKDRHSGIFVGFAPAENPAIAVAVVTEHTCHGGSGAAPIARAVIKKYLEKYFPERYLNKITPEPTGIPEKSESDDEAYAIENDLGLDGNLLPEPAEEEIEKGTPP